MANKPGEVGSIINSAAVQKQINDLVKGMDLVISKMEKIAELAAKTGVDMRSVTSVKGLTEEQKKLAAAEQEAANIEKKRNSEMEKATVLIEKQISKKQADEEKKLNAEREKAIKLAEKETEYLKKHGELWVKLNREKEAATVKARELTLKYGALNKETQQAVKIQNDLDEKVKKLNVTMGNHRDDVGRYTKVWDNLKGSYLAVAGVIGGVITAGAGLISFFKESISKAIDAQHQNNLMIHSMDGNIAAANRMMAFRDKLNMTTTFSKADINSAIVMSNAMGRTEAQTKEMIVTAMGVSKVLGVDMNTAMLQLSGTLEGSKGRLGRLSSEIKNMSDEALKNGDAITVLNSKYAKFAEEGMDGVEGKLVKIDKLWSKFKKSIGEAVVPVIANVLTDLVGSAEEKMQAEIDRWQKFIDSGNKTLSANKGKEFIGNTAVTTAEYKIQIDNAEKSLKNLKSELDLLQKKAELKQKTATLEASRSTFEADLLAAKTKYYGPGGGSAKEGDGEDKKREKIILTIEQLQRYYSLLQALNIIPSDTGVSRLSGKTSGVQVKDTSKDVKKMSPIAGGDIGDLTKMNKADYMTDLEKEKEIWQKRLEFTKDFISQIQNITDAYYSNLFGQMNKEASDDQNAKEKELKAAGDNKTKQNAINEKYAQKEAKREADRKKALHEQAVYQRLVGVAQIIINTAINAMSQGTLIGAIAYVALGAIELAALLATNIPSYQKGREGGPAELAKVHRGEIIASKTGMMFTPDVPESLAYLPAGADVIPAHKVLEMAGRFSTPSIGKPTVLVNVHGDRYSREMLAEMKKPKTETKIYQHNGKLIRETGNYKVISG